MLKRGTSIIFLNDNEEVLLFLRDDIPSIMYPNMWDILGGGVEEYETPEECIVREMKEELGIELNDFNLFEVTDFPDRTEFTFWKRVSFNVNDLVLTEGQALKWFSREEVAATPLAFGFNETLKRFYDKLPILRQLSPES